MRAAFSMPGFEYALVLWSTIVAVSFRLKFPACEFFFLTAWNLKLPPHRQITLPC